MTPHKLLSDIQSGKFSPVYYFYGTEDYRIVEAEKYVAGQFLPQGLLMTNYRRLDGRKTPATDLMAELSIYPMLGERQVFAVSDFQAYKPTDLSRIIKLFNPPDPNRVVILSSPSVRKPKRDSSFMKTVGAAAVGVEFKKLTPEEAVAQIKGKLTKAGLSIDSRASELLAELLAGNRGALESETEKLINFKSSGETVNVEDVQALAVGYEVFEVYQIGEAAATGNSADILRRIKKLIAEGNSPTGIVYFLGQHFISLYLVRNGKPLEPNRRWLAMKLREQATRFSSDHLERIILATAETDSQLRRLRVSQELLLEQLVLTICSKDTAA